MSSLRLGLLQWSRLPVRPHQVDTGNYFIGGLNFALNCYSVLNTFWVYDVTVYSLSSLHCCRVKMCTKVNMRDLLSIHHELGHIHYYMQYRHLPLVFRKGANQGEEEHAGKSCACYQLIQ